MKPMKTKSVLFASLLAALATNAAAEEFVCSTNSVGTIRLDAYLPDSNPSKTVIVPDYVNVIGEYAFCDQATITCVYLPDSVTEIRNGAFCGCYTLSHIRMSLNIEVI